MSVHITSGDLDEWSRRRDSEGHLPTLVRRLIMASSRPDWIRMPAAEGVALSGLDGIITISGSSHPYVPTGDSVWELGTEQGQRGKATGDYEKRTGATPVEVRRKTTYVAVTNRRWSKGDEWIADMKARGDEWKDIVALTADELTIWLEQFPGVEGWLREHLGKGSLGDVAINTWFERWSKQTQPATPDAVLTAGRRMDVIALLDVLDGPADEAHIVAASSVEEAVGFVAAALRLGPSPLPKDPAEEDAGEESKPDPAIHSSEHLEALRERTIVITDEAGWRRWSNHHTPHILVPLFMPDSVTEAIDVGHHVVLPKAARSAHDMGRLQPIDPHAGADAWRSASIDFYKAQDYALAARRNLGTLRRRLSRHGHQTPSWATGPNASLLASALLAGSWDASKEGDQEVLLALTRQGNWADLIRTLTPLTTGEDPPLGLLGNDWDFVDVVDAWDAIGTLITPDDLATFMQAAIDVLAETDPDAGLTAEERFRLSFDDTRPRRRYSNSLRRGIATTIAILGAHTGDAIAAGTITGQQTATQIVRDLLQDADEDRWVTLTGGLQLLAEAAPDAFLHAVETSLRSENPAVMGLFNERKDLLGSHSSHSSLLWALETLAFSPTHVARVAITLAGLAVLDPGGTLGNRPAASLISVLNVISPDGAINADNRIDVLDAVIAAVPEHATDLLRGLVENRGTGIIAAGPRYRDWPTLRHRASSTEYQEALTEICTRLLTVPAEGLLDVAALLSRFSSADMARILDMLTARWDEIDEDAQAEVLTKIADEADRHRRYSDAAWAMPKANIDAIDRFLAGRGYDLEAGKDEALFTWSADIDDHRHTDGGAELAEKTLDERRVDVVRALLAAGGIETVAAFAHNVEVPGCVGKALAELDINQNLGLVDEVLDRLGDGTAPGQPGSDVAWGYAVTHAENFTWLADQVTKRPNQAAVLLSTVRTSAAVLGMVANLEEPQKALFWKRTNPYRIDGDVVEQVCEGLLAAGRPFSAMTAATVRDSAGPSADLIVRVLSADLDNINEPRPEDSHQLSYPVGLLLDRLERLGVDDETISSLEYYYLPVLDDYRQPRALHRELARKPELFATAVSNVYKTDNEPKTDVAAAVAGTETSGMTDEQFRFSSAAWRLLNGWHGPLPGTITPDELPTTEAVQAWVDQVRVELASRDRTQIASAVIGDALAAPIADEDGTWPCEPVRNVIEHEQSDDLESELRVNRLNQRGVHGRTVYAGGDQERAIAAKYRENADKVRNRWPRTGALLEILARAYDNDARREDDDAERDARRHR